jgi:membrane protease YdiL (CAAX protease family)
MSQKPEQGVPAHAPRAVSDGLYWLIAAGAGFLAGGILAQVSVLVWAAATGNATDGRLAHLQSLASPPEGLVLCELVGLWVGLLCAAGLASRLRGTRHFARDMGLAIRLWPDIPLGIVTGAALQFIVIPELYVPLARYIPHFTRQFSRPAKRIAGASQHGSALLVLFLFVAVLAPIVEEIFFRGLLMRSLERLSSPAGKIASSVVPVIGSAILFGLAHYELLQLLGLVVVGLVLAWFALKTGRLGPGIITHMTFNAIALAATAHLLSG